MATEKKKKSIFQSVLGGDILTEQVIVQQWKLVALGVVLVIFLISNDYACRKKLTKIEHLKTELQDVKYDNLYLMTRLTQISRQSRLIKLLQENGIELTGATTPAYEIEK
ncbi:MAG: hypothetical protein LBN93_07750 [Candidatus Symbiothrix sp.]|jgi:hypothetical protein|nr:hypothetical protein [Candidatus Symbiothrix sp.]